MKKFLLMLCLTGGYLFAQDNIILEKNYFKATDEEQFLKDVALLPNNEKLMVYQSDDNRFPVHFQRFDTAGKLLKESKHNIKDRYITDVFVLNNTIYILNQDDNDSSKSTDYYVTTANVNDLKFTEKKILSIPKEKRLYDDLIFNADQDDSFLQVVVNEDKSAFCIYLDTKGKKGQDVRKIMFFDTAKQELITEYIYASEAKEKVYLCRGFHIADNENTIFLIGDVRERVGYGDGKKPYMEIQKLSGGQMQRIKLSVDKSVPRKLALVPKKDKLSIIGFYGVPNTMWVSGFCYFDVDPAAFTLTNSKFHLFPEQFNIDKFGKNKAKEIADVDAFREIFLMENGDILFSAEAESYMSFETGRYINYEDIAVAKFADNGSLLWARNINKDQNGLRNYCLSYKSALKGDDMYFFLNAEEDVKDLGKGRPEFKNGRENAADFMVIKLDKAGQLTYKKLLDNKEKIVTPNPQFCVDAEEPNSFYIFGQSDENKLLAKIKL